MEISRSRKDFLTSDDAVSIFIKDIEENYHDKFLLEDKVKENRNRLSQINKEVGKKKAGIADAPNLGITLQHLFQNGVNEKAIMSMYQINTEFGHGNLRLDPPTKTKSFRQRRKGSDNSNSNDNTAIRPNTGIHLWIR